ncbi:S-layer homology domain-containing protein [Solibacillus daqui]|uniref:S-layer homology domain-containing protein n=1 Tax=Solibacillus daqui TaxID=2912187 RepID=UPI0023667A89|nr:S-layer homology domain-containing protein [Solibacillus daqui]
MKPFLYTLMLLFGFSLQVNAEEPLSDYLKNTAFWHEGEVLTAPTSKYSSGYERYGYYRIEVAEDSLYTFTLVKDTNIKLMYGSPTKQGDIIWLSSNVNDRDPEKTVHQIQLKKGTYGIYISNSPEQPYEASYQVSDLISPYYLEPNNSRQEAIDIPINTVIEQVTTSDDLYQSDYYRFTLTVPSLVKINGSVANKDYNWVSVSITNAEKNVYDLGRDLKAGEQWPANKGHVVEVLQPGTYYVSTFTQNRVYDRQYRFEIEAQPIENPETFKRGDSDTPIMLNTKYRGVISRNDDFSFTLQESKKIGVVVNSELAEENGLQMQLIKRDQQDLSKNIYIESDIYAKSNRLHYTYNLEPGKYTIILGSSFDRPQIDYTISAYDVPFSDITSKNAYVEEIMYLTDKEIIKGYEDGTFKPANSITRRQVFLMLSRDTNLQFEKIRPMTSFQDVAENSEDYAIITPFYEAGIIDGSYGKMQLSQSLTRAQLAKILVNAYNLKMQAPVADFNDVSKTHYAYHYIKILASNGISIGYKGNFKPNDPVTREHFSVFLARMQ